jgi:hypothetical protein
MVGMLTGDRMVRLEVSGVSQGKLTRRSNYDVTVPYASMSQTMQNIMRSGGRVTGVHVSDVPAASATLSQRDTQQASTTQTPAKKSESRQTGKGKKK